MRWKTLFIVVVALTAVSLRSQERATAPTDRSCRKFVQNFYDWYVAHLAGSAATYPTVLKTKANLFSPTLVRLLREDYAASEANPKEVVGLDFDPFLNSQDPSPKFVVTKATVQQLKCSAEVHGITDGVNNEAVYPELTYKNGAWRFVNFRYEQSDLLSTLKSLRSDRH